MEQVCHSDMLCTCILMLQYTQHCAYVSIYVWPLSIYDYVDIIYRRRVGTIILVGLYPKYAIFSLAPKKVWPASLEFHIKKIRMVAQ